MRALVFSIDDQYVIPFQVLFHSLHQTGSLVDSPPVFILHESTLSAVSIAELHRFFENYGQQVLFVDATSYVPDDLPISDDDHVSKATFYRLFVAEILPAHISSALYLDSDTVAVRSIRELLHVALSAPIAAVDHMSPCDQLRMWGCRGGSYFQAGVMLIDLDYWRANNCSEMFVDIMKTQRHRIEWWDQDVLNIVFADNWQRLDAWLNVGHNVVAAIPVEKIKEKMRLLHFDGSHKPWLQDIQRPFRDVWLDAYESVFAARHEKYVRLPGPLVRLTSQTMARMKRLIS